MLQTRIYSINFNCKLPAWILLYYHLLFVLVTAGRSQDIQRSETVPCCTQASSLTSNYNQDYTNYYTCPGNKKLHCKMNVIHYFNDASNVQIRTVFWNNCCHFRIPTVCQLQLDLILWHGGHDAERCALTFSLQLGRGRSE